MSETPCSECGCIGNSNCGANPVSVTMQCSLDEDLVCPCCDILGTEQNKARWPENNIAPDAEQIEMEF